MVRFQKEFKSSRKKITQVQGLSLKLREFVVGSLYAIPTFCFLFYTNAAWANESVTGTLEQGIVLRQMHDSEQFLTLIDELKPTEFHLPAGTKISYTQGNTHPAFAYEDDQVPGEIVESSIFPFQQNIRIDHLPGYNDQVKSSLNAKRIFISEPQLKLVKLDVQSQARASHYHSCNAELVKKVNADRQLSAKLKSNFPKVLQDTLAAQKKYGSKGLRDDYVAFIDYSVSSAERRFFLINLSTCTYQTEFVSHGSGVKGAGGTKAMLTNCATGRIGANSRKNRTRDGFYKISGGHRTSKKWPVVANIKGVNYKALKLVSLDGKHPDVESAGVVMHEAPSYVFNIPQVQGRSSGCPAFAKGRLKSVVSRVNGAILNIYAPQCR